MGKAIMTKRWKEEFDRKNPPPGHMINTWPVFYFGMLMPERDPNVVTPGLPLNHFELLAHIYHNDLHWNGMQWAVKREG
ncbi:hypothetical protein [Pseudomonas salomonii]|uniref:hypothetical protein n=1 Tax=Pseudomonas salomonii TaxID=191391 RepID=UPI001FD42202|nr:hypothetical protein [Pseudomonas salomonii]